MQKSSLNLCKGVRAMGQKMVRKGMSERARLSRKTNTKTNSKANTNTIWHLCKSGGTGYNDKEEIGHGEVENERIGELPQGGGAHDRDHHQQRANRCNLVFLVLFSIARSSLIFNSSLFSSSPG